MSDYNVIVIGSGAAGLSAAIAASDQGASVLVMEADKQIGGSSRLSGGHFYAAGTSLQESAGVDDSADAMFEHYMTLNQWMVEPSVVRRYCDESAPTFEWVRELGVSFPQAGLYQSGVGTIPRGHQPEGAGEEVIRVLDYQRSTRGVDLVLNSRVDHLLTDDHGAVCGISAAGDTATCGSVVIAAGGFGANPELLAQYYPDAAACGDWSWYIGSEGAQGDGLSLGGNVGAALDGHNRGLLLVTPGFSRDLEVLLPGWLILVNQDGRRFTSETAPYTMLGGLIQRQEGSVFAVFDEGARRDAAPGPMSTAYWVNEILEQKAEAGRIARAERIDDLCAQIGVNPGGLKGTLERYNADCELGEDTTFMKPADSGMRPIKESPYYAVEVRPAIICWTGTGLRINADTCVLSTHERPIEGLFAAGETVGSLHGDRYIGGGGSFGPCIVFGKLAGENAAAFAHTTQAFPTT